jgi:small-conductance mechanosensitive channel
MRRDRIRQSWILTTRKPFAFAPNRGLHRNGNSKVTRFFQVAPRLTESLCTSIVLMRLCEAWSFQPGAHVISMTHRSVSFYLGLSLTVLGLVLAALILVYGSLVCFLSA